MINVPLFRFQQCMGTFTMFLYHEGLLLKYLSNHVFGSRYFWKNISFDCHLYFLKYVENLRNSELFLGLEIIPYKEDALNILH